MPGGRGAAGMMAAPTPAPTAWCGGGRAAAASWCRRRERGRLRRCLRLQRQARRPYGAGGRERGRLRQGAGHDHPNRPSSTLWPSTGCRLKSAGAARLRPPCPLSVPRRTAAKGAGNAQRGAPCRAASLPRTRHDEKEVDTRVGVSRRQDVKAWRRATTPRSGLHVLVIPCRCKHAGHDGPRGRH